MIRISAGNTGRYERISYVILADTDTDTTVVTRTRRAVSRQRRGEDWESGGGRRREGAARRKGDGEWERGETDRRRNKDTDSAKRRGQTGDLPTPVLTRPRQGQRRGVWAGHCDKAGSQLLRGRWFCCIQVRHPAGA